MATGAKDCDDFGNQRSALELGDRVAILNAGRFEQVDTFHNISSYPASPFVASFMGNANGYANGQAGGQVDVVGNGFDGSGPILDPDSGFQPLDDGDAQRSSTTLSFLTYPVLLDLDRKNLNAGRVLLPGRNTSNQLNPGGHGAIAFGSLKIFPSGPVELGRTKRSNPDSAISANGQSES